MDFIISFLFTNPLVPYALGGIGLLVAYRLIAPRLRITVPGGGGLSTDAILGKLLGPRYAEAKLQKTIHNFKRDGQYLGAGKLLEEKGRLPEAAEAYIEGQEYWAAAATLERLGKTERAADLYLQAGDHKKAAQMLADAGKHARAAVLFLERGNTLEAARLFGLAAQWDKAADLYAKGGYPLRAAEAYEKVGEYLKAAECYEKHFMENVSFSTTYSQTAPSVDQKSALHAGRLYEKAGDLNKALSVYNKGQYFKPAASVCQRLGQHGKAAELFLRAEDPQSAAEAFDKAGDTVQASTLRGEVSLKQGRLAEAAAYFQKGQDYLRAAELFESQGMLAEAAGAYEAGESWAAAGAVYIRAGLKDRAARSFERAGDYETAARLFEEAGQGQKSMELYERAGFTFKSGEAAARAGLREKAIALLQRVNPGDENYRPAAELLARLFIEGGMPGLAVERIQKALGNEGVSAPTIELYYWLAMGHEAAGRAKEALDVYRKVMAEDLMFKDVERRVTRLEAGGAPLTPPPTAARPQAAPGAIAPPASRQPATAADRAKPPRFVCKEEIGRGPLGVVFRAEDQVDGRSVALRLLPPELVQGPEVLRSLGTGLKVVAAVSHPNLVKVLGLIQLDGKPALITEFVKGHNFAEALKSGHKATVQQVHGVARIVSQALTFLHEKGIVHGSVQPSNMMVANGIIKLADLGLASLARSVAPSLDYREPGAPNDIAADLYALAATLYHLLTGIHPRSKPQGAGLPLPSSLASGVSEALDKLLLRALHPRRELRFASAEEIQRELKDMVRLV